MGSVIDDWLWNKHMSTVAILDDYDWWAHKHERYVIIFYLVC